MGPADPAASADTRCGADEYGIPDGSSRRMPEAPRGRFRQAPCRPASRSTAQPVSSPGPRLLRVTTRSSSQPRMAAHPTRRRTRSRSSRSFRSPPAAGVGEVGVAFQLAPHASGGKGENTWSLATGSLPAGLTMDPAYWRDQRQAGCRRQDDRLDPVLIYSRLAPPAR